MIWYKKAKSDFVIEGPINGENHMTSAYDFLNYLIFVAKDTATNKDVGYILFQTPKDDISQETLEKAEDSAHIKRYLNNSFTLQVAVKEDLRKQGIGSKLYAAVDDYLAKNNKPKLMFFNYAHLSPAAQHIWDKRLKSKTAAGKDFNYFSIGHSRDHGNIILWVHDGKQLYQKASTPQQKTHLSAFPGIDDIARGRIEISKGISSFSLDIPDNLSIMQKQFLRKKVIDDLKSAHPNIRIMEHGKDIDENDTFAQSYFTLKTAQFGAGYGEWWIDEDGGTMYADIDIGDMGHEAFVIEHARGIVMHDFHTYSENAWDEYLSTLARELLDDAQSNEARKMHIENYIGEDIENITENDLIDQDYVEDFILNEKKANKKIVDIAFGRGDIRLFGVKDLNWKRVMNKFVETWFLTPKDCAIIARGLGEIAQEDEEGNSLWTIEVRSSGKIYSNIPLMVIEKGPVAINNYSRTQQQER